MEFSNNKLSWEKYDKTYFMMPEDFRLKKEKCCTTCKIFYEKIKYLEKEIKILKSKFNKIKQN